MPNQRVIILLLMTERTFNDLATRFIVGYLMETDGESFIVIHAKCEGV